MAQIVLGIASVLALHSLGLIIASLVTNKWYTDSKKDIGVYGICEHVQPSVTTYNETYYYYRNKYSYSSNTAAPTQPEAAVSQTTQQQQPATANVSDDENGGRARSAASLGSQRLFKKRRNNVFLITASGADENEKKKQPPVPPYNVTAVPKSGVVVKKGSLANNTKCYQLIWPDSMQAYQYLTVKTTYKITLMGVSICSASFAILTSIWSIICAIFSKIGSNIRSNEILIGLSIITDVITILTFLLFMCKDDRIHHIEFYGYSFWFSVAASAGYFLASILFILNRINLRFMYMLRSYEEQSAKSLN